MFRSQHASTEKAARGLIRCERQCCSTDAEGFGPMAGPRCLNWKTWPLACHKSWLFREDSGA